jgi:hypothetical protein
MTGAIQQVTWYYHAAYLIAAVVYGSYVISLIVRARRASAKLEAATRRS